MMWDVTVTSVYMTASLRQSTKYEQFQMPINWATLFQPFPLPPTRSLVTSVYAAATWPELGLTKAELLLLQETNSYPCEQVMWWICDTLWNRETTFANPVVLQDIVKTATKQSNWNCFFHMSKTDHPWIALVFLNYKYYFSSSWVCDLRLF